MGKSLMIVDDSATMRKIIMRTVRMSGLAFDRTKEHLMRFSLLYRECEA